MRVKSVVARTSQPEFILKSSRILKNRNKKEFFYYRNKKFEFFTFFNNSVKHENLTKSKEVKIVESL